MYLVGATDYLIYEIHLCQATVWVPKTGASPSVALFQASWRLTQGPQMDPTPTLEHRHTILLTFTF